MCRVGYVPSLQCAELSHNCLSLILKALTITVACTHKRTVQCDDLFVADLYSGKIFVAMSGKFWHCLFLCFKNRCCRHFS